MKIVTAAAAILLESSALFAQPSDAIQTGVQPDTQRCDAVKIAKEGVKKRYHDFDNSMMDYIVVDRFGTHLVVNMTFKKSTIYNGALVAIKERDCKISEFHWSEP